MSDQENSSMTIASPQPLDAAKTPILCSNCEAVCCRLTVVLMPEDKVPAWLVTEDDFGPDTMTKAEDGWCVALDRDTMRCSIYDQRPTICAKFAMAGPYCSDERDEYAAKRSKDGIPFTWR
jgi:uncharacterized protein